MKILTGNLQGRTIQFKPNAHVRATADKVRKAVFDALQSVDFSDKKCLDLFSGSGAMGFEALSQGSQRVTFVEQNRAQVSAIEKNISALGLDASATVFCEDVFKAIEKLSRKNEAFEFIFVDPPYEEGLGTRTLRALAVSKIIKADTLIVAECNKREDFPLSVGSIQLTREKLYGDTKVLFYTVEQPSS